MKESALAGGARRVRFDRSLSGCAAPALEQCEPRVLLTSLIAIETVELPGAVRQVIAVDTDGSGTDTLLMRDADGSVFLRDARLEPGEPEPVARELSHGLLFGSDYALLAAAGRFGDGGQRGLVLASTRGGSDYAVYFDGELSPSGSGVLDESMFGLVDMVAADATGNGRDELFVLHRWDFGYRVSAFGLLHATPSLVYIEGIEDASPHQMLLFRVEDDGPLHLVLVDSSGVDEHRFLGWRQSSSQPVMFGAEDVRLDAPEWSLALPKGSVDDVARAVVAAGEGSEVRFFVGAEGGVWSFRLTEGLTPTAPEQIDGAERVGDIAVFRGATPYWLALGSDEQAFVRWLEGEVESVGAQSAQVRLTLVGAGSADGPLLALWGAPGSTGFVVARLGEQPPDDDEQDDGSGEPGNGDGEPDPSPDDEQPGPLPEPVDEALPVVSAAADWTGRLVLATRSMIVSEPLGLENLWLFEQQELDGGWGRSFHDGTMLRSPGVYDRAHAWLDPKDGALYAAAPSDGGLMVLRHLGGSWIVMNATADTPGAAAIERGLTVFTSGDGLVHVAGFLSNGDLAVYRQTGGRTENGAWAFEYINLYAQLRSRQLSVPSIDGPIISYVTAWNGLNIAGVSRDGDIWSIWTAPGMDHWRSDNLSAITQAPKLVGGVTAYLTPWSGINLAGIDESGRLAVTWWVPSFGSQWVTSDLTEMFGGPLLRPGSLTSYVTAWNGLNVAGLDADNEVVVYWWVPEFAADPETDRWVVSPLSEGLPGDAPRPAGPLSALAAPDGRLNIVAVDEGGMPVRLWWMPGRDWTLEDVGRSSIASVAPFAPVLLMPDGDGFTVPALLRVVLTDERGRRVELEPLQADDSRLVFAPPPGIDDEGRLVEAVYTVALEDADGGPVPFARPHTLRVHAPPGTDMPAGGVMLAFVEGQREFTADLLSRLDRSHWTGDDLATALEALDEEMLAIEAIVRPIVLDPSATTVAGEFEDGRPVMMDAATLREMDRMVLAGLNAAVLADREPTPALVQFDHMLAHTRGLAVPPRHTSQAPLSDADITVVRSDAVSYTKHRQAQYSNQDAQADNFALGTAVALHSVGVVGLVAGAKPAAAVALGVGAGIITALGIKVSVLAVAAGLEELAGRDGVEHLDEIRRTIDSAIGVAQQVVEATAKSLVLLPSTLSGDGVLRAADQLIYAGVSRVDAFNAKAEEVSALWSEATRPPLDWDHWHNTYITKIIPGLRTLAEITSGALPQENIYSSLKDTMDLVVIPFHRDHVLHMKSEAERHMEGWEVIALNAALAGDTARYEEAQSNVQGWRDFVERIEGLYRTIVFHIRY